MYYVIERTLFEQSDSQLFHVYVCIKNNVSLPNSKHKIDKPIGSIL